MAGRISNHSTNHVLLRDVTEDDIPVFYEHQLDPDAIRMSSFPSRGRNMFTAHWLSLLVNETVIKRTILCDGRVAGNIVSYVQFGKREVGYWLGKEYWGKGIATTALSEFLGLEQTRPLYSHVAKQNIASIRVLEKCGFTICGEEKGLPDPGGEEVEEFILVLKA